jgi:predicted PurR-regulated permease PerM
VHPLLILLGFIGGPLTLGLKGLVLGPLSLGLLQALVELYSEKGGKLTKLFGWK